MYICLRFERQHGQLSAQLLARERIGGNKERQDRIGSLGRVRDTEPVNVGQRARFWAGLDQRFAVLRGRHPISEADEAKLRDRIDTRIPRARDEAEARLFRQATAVRDAAAAFDCPDGGAVEESMQRLLALARETLVVAEAAE
jgi:hypothetical protein